MGDAREPGDATPLARVHRLPGRSRPGISAGRAEFRAPSLRLHAGRVVELDERLEAEFDPVDAFLARHGLDLVVAVEAMEIDPVTFGRMLVHPVAPAGELLRLAAGMTPAQLADALAELRPGELVMALRKLRTARGRVDERPPGGEVLVIGPAQAPPGAAAGDTPWSTALLISSYAARGLRSRIAGGRTTSVGQESLRHAVRRVVLARAVGAWGVVATRTDEGPGRVDAEELAALLLGLDSRPAVTTTAGAPDDFGTDPAGLRRRAALLAEAGRPRVAATFERAAELAALDDDEVGRLCASLRPDGAHAEDLAATAAGLEESGAPHCAALFAEAASTYRQLGLSG